MDSVKLYHYQSEDNKITIDAYFEGDFLVIDGFDIGKTVEKYWGDSDYEYMVKIPKEGIDFLYTHLNVTSGDRQKLLQELAKTYNTNSCYSDIRQLMTDNNIKCEGFTWV